MAMKKKRIISLLLLIVMVCTCALVSTKLTVSAAKNELVEQSESEVKSNLYEEGDLTKVTVKAFAQNTSNDWTWMNLDEIVNLLYRTETELNATNIDNAFADANSTANFGLQVTDEKLLAGEGSKLKFFVGTITVKADGYDDLIIDLDKEYDEFYLAEEVSWGFQGNNTMIILNDYLPSDQNEKIDYIHNITQVIADITLTDYEFIAAEEEGPEFPDNYTYPTTMRGLSAMELVEDMEVGWNLGNTLEAEGGETNWGNPKTKRKMIDLLKTAGFSTIRIPVRWDQHYIDDNYTIDPEFIDRVETVVNYALINDMYAIINIHHNELQSQVNEESKDKVLEELDAIWTQVASHFKDYGDQLIFETINEPRNGEDWTGNTNLYEIVNEYNEKALNAIRLTGGNNDTRLVMLPTYAASADYDKIIAMKVPEDDENIAVSLHSYTPYDFALNTAPGSQSTFGDNDKRILDNLFSLINTTFVEKGIPVVLGEFAATDKDNLDDRVEYTYYYSQAAAHYNIPVFWWDNGNFGEGEAMAILNRRKLDFEYPEILQALMDGWYSEKEIIDTDPNVLFSGRATSSDWGQAVAFQLGLDFVFDDFTDGLIIAVDYQSDNAPELILQGQASEVEWVKVNPTKIDEDETSNTAYFSLTDMVDAYSSALPNYDSYDTIFPTLSTIYIGDTGTDLTVTKVYKIFEAEEPEDPEEPEEPEEPGEPSTESPSVTVSTKNSYNSISQTYTITAEGGDIDLSKLKIVYTSPGISTESHHIWCHHAGLTQDTPDWFYQLTDSVNCDINKGNLTITIDRNLICPESHGVVTLDIQFAKTDWSYYGDLTDQVLKVYYDGVLVQ